MNRCLKTTGHDASVVTLRFGDRRITIRGSTNAPKNAPEKAEQSPLIGGVQSESAKHEAEVVSVGCLHRARRVVGRKHDVVYQSGQNVEIARRGAGFDCFRRGWIRAGGDRFRSLEGRWLGVKGAGGEFVEADRRSLSKIHGRLPGVGGNLNEHVATCEIFAGEAMLFRTKDKCNAATPGQFLRHDGSKSGKGDDGLLRFAAGQRARADDERAVGYSFGEALRAFCALEKVRGPDCGARFAPVWLVGCDHFEMREAEVGHGACDRSDVERITGRDEDDINVVALG
jgi:hypothetical protein